MRFGCLAVKWMNQEAREKIVRLKVAAITTYMIIKASA
jgi:hypothetical protein